MTDSSISFKQWVRVGTDCSQLAAKEYDSDEFTDSLTTMFIELTKHHFIAKKQSEFFKYALVLNFAQNYSFIVQDAAQDFHWKNSQATIHPFVLYYMDANTNSVQQKVYACISDHTIHDTVAVNTFVKNLLLEYFKPSFPQIKEVIYFSHGSAAQYKNYKNFTNLIFHENDFNLKAEWPFIAMSHGKNACDGVGGTLIGLAAHASLQRPFSEQILNIKQLCKFANSEITSVTTLFVNLQSVQKNIPLTAGFQIGAPSKEITRIMSLFHCYEPCVWSCFQKFTYPTKRKCFVY